MSNKMTGYYTTFQEVNYGERIIPLKRIQLFDPDEWEDFIEEWVDVKRSDYCYVEKLGGAGDMGRDVVAYITKSEDKNDEWDCYQCKHYNNALTPSNIYLEFGKILYYTFNNNYTIPRKYYFISPKGCGTTLSGFLKDSELLKRKIKENWNTYCKDNITNKPIELEGDLLKYWDKFDYSIFSKISTKEIIEEHKAHPNHITRFGGGLPKRKKLSIKEISSYPSDSESIYIQQLILAYESESLEKYKAVEFLAPKYKKHLDRARINFHYAEQLRNFSRDSLPIGAYSDLQDDFYEGVIDSVEDDYENGFLKVKAVENISVSIQIDSNPLRDVLVTKDRKGICHQLVNDEKIKWIEDEE